MSSPPPERESRPDETLFDGDPDANTGPVHVVLSNGQETAAAPTHFPGQVEAGEWGQGYYPPEEEHALKTHFWHPDPAPNDVAPPPNSTMVAPLPAGESFASHFTAPLTVDPRAAKVKGLGIQPTKVLAILGGLVLVAALVFSMFHVFGDDSSDAGGESATQATAQPADREKLQRILPQGYADGSCTPAEPAKGALARVSCTANADAGGPPTASYTLVADTSALRATFDGIVASARQVNCPGNIQSPGPWRRNAAPQLVAGTVFCGFRGDVPIVAWTDDADLLVSSVDGARTGPDLDLLYTWWRGHL